jgi:hypothetical protein
MLLFEKDCSPVGTPEENGLHKLVVDHSEDKRSI